VNLHALKISVLKHYKMDARTFGSLSMLLKKNVLNKLFWMTIWAQHLSCIFTLYANLHLN